MDRDGAQDWLDRYVRAWKSYDGGEIADLFGPDVHYRYHPYDDPIVGVEGVVASWLGTAGPGAGPGGVGEASTRDPEGTYDADYTPYALDGDRMVATGTTVYRDHPGGPVTRTFDNCFLVVFDTAGRCVEFTELYMERPR